jgi:xylulokinase
LQLQKIILISLHELQLITPSAVQDNHYKSGMLLLGIDLGTSSVKVSVVDASSQKVITSAQYPGAEREIIALRPGWAEQSPATWWADVQQAIQICHQSALYQPHDIAAIGIAYQMHGLVMVDKNQEVLRNSIIWCDSRAVDIGEKAFNTIGQSYCLSHLLNSPGNFTASKLAWVKENEPEIYQKAAKIMLPGDFIAMKLTGEVTTSITALSEGIFYDFSNNRLSKEIIEYFGFDHSLFPPVQQAFSVHGAVLPSIAQQLGLQAGIPVAYKAGDQPNNALSLNVLNPGEVAATAGTSGVIYGVSDELTFDPQSRVNTFAHVNYTGEQKRLGVLLCINGTGSLNRWVKNLFGNSLSYQQMNDEAAKAPEGSSGLRILPFGNGAERMLNNKIAGAQVLQIDLNLHTRAHLLRAAQEGIAFAFRYGLDIMRSNGMNPSVIRAGKANLFLSDLFAETFVNITGVPVELYKNDGSVGAAIGAGIGAAIFSSYAEAFTHMKPVQLIEPQSNDLETAYQEWLHLLHKELV